MTFKSFIDYFSDMAKKLPNKPAVITDNTFITYQELHELSNYIAERILNQNVSAEEIIPILFERSTDMIIAMVAILKSGCAFLPLNPLTPYERQLFILNDSKARIFLTHNSGLIKTSDPAIKVINLNDKKKSGIEISNPLRETSLAYVMYTSGSTGNPKGVLIEHSSMINLFSSLIEQLNLNESERVLALTDYTFDIALIELLLPLMIGATIILTEQGTIADGLKIKKYLTQYDITVMQATPVSWEILLKHEWRNNGRLKILVGGEKFNEKLAIRLDYQKSNVFNMYGPTETSMWSMCYPLGPKLSSSSIPLGSALANTTIYLFDENLHPTPRGKEGQIYIGGKGLARGYLNNPSLTEQTFIHHPETGERLYKTGDLAIIDKDNLIYYTGRIDDQYKLNGVRIEAGEIEKIIEQETIVKKAIVKVHEQEGYYKVLSAYVEIDEEKAFNHYFPIVDDSSIQSINNIYNSVYCNAQDHENEVINTSGWKNTFTGQEFLPEELKESYQFIESVISKSDLSSVLEIGSGTGSILTTFINSAKKYTVMEISKQSINYIKSKLNSSQLEKTIFKNQSIAEVNENKQYSCVIVNSVIQYLPSISYLISAFKKLVAATLDGGTVIIGDIRSLELMEVFLIKKNKKSVYYKSRDSEILLSPYFFRALKKEIPEISHIDIAVKHGIYENELNYFRYDAILHINKPVIFRDPIIILYDHNFNSLSFENSIRMHPESPFILKKIPNLAILKMIESLAKQNPLLIKNDLPGLRRISTSENDLQNINFILHRNFETHEKLIQYDQENPLLEMEVYFYPKASKIVRCLTNEVNHSYRLYCREPFSPWLQELCFDKIKRRVAQQLISWIRPSVYSWVERWPLTSNGKIDKKRLDLTKLGEKNNDDKTILGKIQKVWENTTGSHCKVNEDFKAHGPSSLYMYFFLATINEMCEINLGYQELERYNTPFKLAHYINASRKETV